MFSAEELLIREMPPLLSIRDRFFLFFLSDLPRIPNFRRLSPFSSRSRKLQGKGTLESNAQKKPAGAEKTLKPKDRNFRAFTLNFDYRIFITTSSNLSRLNIKMGLSSHFKKKSEMFPINSRNRL
jgi:hypothetical protein